MAGISIETRDRILKQVDELKAMGQEAMAIGQEVIKQNLSLRLQLVAVEAERDAALALLREAREWIEAVPPIHQEMIAKIDAMLAKIDAALGGEDALAESE